MAKIFTTGTSTVASAVVLGETMQDKIRDDVTAHSAWEVVEEYTPGTIDWVVMKCLASVSGLPEDFYVVLGRTISSGALHLMICEGYNSSTHTMSFYPHYYGTSSLNYDSDGRCLQTFVLASTVPGSTTGHPFKLGWTPGAATIKWWIIVDIDMFVVAFNGSPNHFFQVMTYIPMSDMPSDMPVVMAELKAGGSGPDGGQLRNAAGASLSGVPGQVLACYSGGSPIPTYTDHLGLYSFDFRYSDKLNSMKRMTSEITVIQYVNTSSLQATWGYFHGKHKSHFRYTGQQQPTIAWGDTESMEGTLWVRYLPGDYRLWDTGVLL